MLQLPLGTITTYVLKIDTTTIWGTGTYATVTNADMYIALPTANVSLYTFNARLIVTSNLGTKDTAYATFGASSMGFSAYRGSNPNAPVVKLPSITTVVNESNIESVNVYPNPSRDFVKVSFKSRSNTNTLKVYSMYGQLVQQQTNNNSNNQAFTLNINNLPTGTYSIVIVNENGKIIGNSKIIKVMN